MPMDIDEIKKQIIQKFPDAEIEVDDLAGDGDHYAARIISSAFQGKTRIQQHKMIYDCIEGMGDNLHALSIKTDIPR